MRQLRLLDLQRCKTAELPRKVPLVGSAELFEAPRSSLLQLYGRGMERQMTQSFILLIEDNPDDAFLASRIIGKVCTEKIIVARDGEEASELLQRMTRDATYHEIRLVLLDLKLPKISGIEVLQAIRRSADLRNLPVVVLTSSDNDLDQEKCRELGVLDYIYKPITADRLQRVLPRKKDAPHG